MAAKEHLSTEPLRRRQRSTGGRLAVAAMLVALAVSAGCGLDPTRDDPWFTLTVVNDSGRAIELLEPCPDCKVAGFLTTIGPGQHYGLGVLANGGVKTYVVADDRGTRIGCLPTKYDGIPTLREVHLPASMARC